MEGRVFDVIFFYNELDLLNRRIDYLTPYVTKFIVLDFGHTGLYSHRDDTLVYKMNFRKGPFFRNNFFEYLFFLFDFEEFLFDDIFLFSKVNEIPNLSELENELSQNIFDPITLRHQTFGWHPNLKSNETHIGVRIIRYTNYLQNKLISKQLFNKNPLLHNSETIYNGYHLFGFNELSQFIESQKFWLEDDFPYHLDFNLLKSQHNIFDEEGQIKHVEETDFSSLPSLFHDLSFFEMSDELYDLEIDLTVQENQIKYIFNGRESFEPINYPKKVLYSDKPYEQFLQDFRKNEILRILSNLPYTKIDNVLIKKTTETVVFKISELMESVPSELI